MYLCDFKCIYKNGNWRINRYFEKGNTTLYLIPNNYFTSLFWNYLSILCDKSTDVSTQKIFCFVAQRINPKISTLEWRLLEVLHLDAKDSSAKKIYTKFKNYLCSKNILVKNITRLWWSCSHDKKKKFFQY